MVEAKKDPAATPVTLTFPPDVEEGFYIGFADESVCEVRPLQPRFGEPAARRFFPGLRVVAETQRFEASAPGKFPGVTVEEMCLYAPKIAYEDFGPQFNELWRKARAGRVFAMHRNGPSSKEIEPGLRKSIAQALFDKKQDRFSFDVEPNLIEVQGEFLAEAVAPRLIPVAECDKTLPAPLYRSGRVFEHERILAHVLRNNRELQIERFERRIAYHLMEALRHLSPVIREHCMDTLLGAIEVIPVLYGLQNVGLHASEGFATKRLADLDRRLETDQRWTEKEKSRVRETRLYVGVQIGDGAAETAYIQLFDEPASRERVLERCLAYYDGDFEFMMKRLESRLRREDPREKILWPIVGMLRTAFERSGVAGKRPGRPESRSRGST